MVRNVSDAWGDEGRRWLDALPLVLAEVADDWELTVGTAYPLSYHWVAAVTRADGSPAVLKLGVPAGHLTVEAETLGIFAGHGAVRLLAFDPARGALLLERADPGTPAATLATPPTDVAAPAALIEVGNRLHRPVPDGCSLPHSRELAASFRAHLSRFPGDDPLPRRLVRRAVDLLDDLCASSPGDVVLHGDLHHDNMLRATREPWLAIDPHGYVGDPAFECGPMLYNPDPPRRDNALLALVPARIEQFADGPATPVERVVAWGFVMGVLSEVWTASSGGAVGTRALDVALLLEPRLE
jgi:streptomycin 6-kinase